MEFLRTLPSGSPSARLVLAHGAGAPMDSRFMNEIAALLAERGLEVMRFEFAYMAARRTGGKRRPPPKAELLVDEYLAALTSAGSGPPVLIGGKSMGGRVASMLADGCYEQRLIAGLICLGYPFHPPGKPEALRTAHLQGMTCPALIVQGDRDPFGNRAEIEALQLAASLSIAWLDDGDHDFGPRGASGFTRKGNLIAAADAVATFARRVCPSA